MKDYIVFSISADPFAVDLITGSIWELDILGINELSNIIQVSVNEDSVTKLKDIENVLQNLVEQSLIETFEINQELLKNQNWNEEWERKAKIFEVGDRIVVKPSFKKYEPKEGKIILNIDPKMSFGTGEHQTTKIMLKLCERYINVGDKILDLGSGTGILAIAASKLGAKSVVAVDNDDWCYINAQENILNNEITNIILFNGTISDISEKDFDIVLANINSNVILDIKNDLSCLVKRYGKLILSGILISDAESIKRQFIQLGLTAIDDEIMDEWFGVVLEKN
jgi:ribosomal protein L11 methyltransferase